MKYFSFANVSILCKTNRPSFCLKLSHALDGLFNILSRLNGRKHKCAFYWIKYHWTWLLSDTVAWDSFYHGTHCFFSDIYRCCDRCFPGFGKYIFPQLQTCAASVLSADWVLSIWVLSDCTEGSCSSNIIILNNFLVFNFPFFNFKQ